MFYNNTFNFFQAIYGDLIREMIIIITIIAWSILPISFSQTSSGLLLELQLTHVMLVWCAFVIPSIADVICRALNKPVTHQNGSNRVNIYYRGICFYYILLVWILFVISSQSNFVVDTQLITHKWAYLFSTSWNVYQTFISS